MGKIVLLDDLTINQIAAGEVIERPASVVKELCENSIDAGATSICVNVKNGGIESIRITDNGKGISEDDMEIAFERHATSKIRCAEDLEKVSSMGFRGEALASIAAIANVEMVSKTAQTEFGNRIIIEGGKILEKGEVGAPVGTTITIRNLFFNTPVRYKFLKKDYTELGYIEDVITRLSLVNVNVAFKLISNDKTIIQTMGDGNIQNAIYSIYGKDVASNVIPVDYIYENMKVRGVIGKAEIARNTRTHQIFFVNNRYVKDKTLSSAIEQSYKGMITVGKHAFCILNIDMPQEDVDVNVHPAKLEVRFKDEGKIFRAVYHAVKESLIGTDISKEEEEKAIEDLKNIAKREQEESYDRTSEGFKSKLSSLFRKKNENEFNEKYSNNNSKIDENTFRNADSINVVEDLYNFKNETEGKNNKQKLNEEDLIPDTMKIQKNEEPQEKIEINKIQEKEENEILLNENNCDNHQDNSKVSSEEMNQNFEEMYEKTFGTKLREEKEVYTNDFNIEETFESIDKENQDSLFNKQDSYYEKINYKFIGIIFDTYIILEIDNTMYILDQHAAHERIMYEKVRKNYFEDENKDSQLMLLPDVITLTHKEFENYLANKYLFEKAGFTMEDFGENTIKLTGVPNICMELDTKQLFLDLLDEIGGFELTARQEKEDKFLSTIACKAAVKANMRLSEMEVDSLMTELFKLPNPFTCPHGRPTVIEMSKIDIEKKFSRR